LPFKPVHRRNPRRIYVANDGTPCWLFANRGNLRFEEIGETAGVACDGQGQALAGMGVAAGDVNDDGLGDLIVTNFLARSTIVFQAQQTPPGTFLDQSSRLGLARCTRHVLGFGIALVDFDAGGRLDLIQANGRVLDRARLGIPSAMRPTLLRSTGGGFEDIADQVGGWFERPILGRGLAVGDLDGEGRPDVVVNVLDGPAAVLRNTSGSDYFLDVDVVDHAGRTAVGCSRSRHGRRPNPGGLCGVRGKLSERVARRFVLRSRFVAVRGADRGRMAVGAEGVLGEPNAKHWFVHAHRARNRPADALTALGWGILGPILFEG
jgi:hypothetical protein